MKHFVSISLLAVLLGTVGCVHYGAATSPYYTSYYNAYDTYNRCYYHPSRFYRCCGPGLGFVGDGHARNTGGSGGTSNFGNGVQHGSGSHRGGGGGGGHRGGGGSHHSGSSGHSHSSSSSSSGGHHR